MLRIIATQVSLLLLASTAQAENPTITVSKVAACGQGSGSWGEHAGAVTGTPITDQTAVVLYAVTNIAYVQPFRSKPFTEVSPDGAFATGSHLGNHYIYLLVDRERFSPPATATPTSLANLPGVLAVFEAPCKRD